MAIESANSRFEPVSVRQKEVNELLEICGPLEPNAVLVLPDSEAVNLVPAPLRTTNFRLRTLVVKPGERNGTPIIEIHQRHAPIETLRDPDKRQAWASIVGTEQESLPVLVEADRLEIRRTGSYVDLTLTYDQSNNNWMAEGKTLYPEEKPAGLVHLATTLINTKQKEDINDLPLAV